MLQFFCITLVYCLSLGLASLSDVASASTCVYTTEQFSRISDSASTIFGGDCHGTPGAGMLSSSWTFRSAVGSFFTWDTGFQRTMYSLPPTVSLSPAQARLLTGMLLPQASRPRT